MVHIWMLTVKISVFIAERMNLRITPEITFVEDSSIEYGAKISKILEGITYSDEQNNEQEDKND